MIPIRRTQYYNTKWGSYEENEDSPIFTRYEFATKDGQQKYVEFDGEVDEERNQKPAICALKQAMEDCGISPEDVVPLTPFYGLDSKIIYV